MTRRFLALAAILFAARISAHADLLKSSVLESNVAYLRVGDVGKNLPGEIQSAESSLTATNKIAGTVLDLRFADGSDSAAANATAKLFAARKLPMTILVDDQTHGAATALALALRQEKAGLIFGTATAEAKPDVVVAIKPDDEKKFLENPYWSATNEIADLAGTNELMPFVDHMSEAQLVRDRRKDGEDTNLQPSPPAEPATPVIRDPMLARAVDLIEGMAVVRAKRR